MYEKIRNSTHTCTGTNVIQSLLLKVSTAWELGRHADLAPTSWRSIPALEFEKHWSRSLPFSGSQFLPPRNRNKNTLPATRGCWGF